MKKATKDMLIGSKLPTDPFNLSRESIASFHYMISGIEASDNDIKDSIHLDPEFARSVGLPDVIADGAQTSAEISRILTDYFGDGFLEGGCLFTKFIKPVYPDYTLKVDIQIECKSEEGDAVRYDMDISCTNQDDLLVLVGNATAWVR
ncbi:MAG: hypothetical protein IH955_00920 [Chloroflexi bacterium]|nr:hypothetical protein [Chloroflexota bacterium]